VIPDTRASGCFLAPKKHPHEMGSEKGNVKILNGPMEVPGGSSIVNAMDPQGAAFSLHGGKRNRLASLRGATAFTLRAERPIRRDSHTSKPSRLCAASFVKETLPVFFPRPARSVHPARDRD
jgi:hypothetical protein